MKLNIGKHGFVFNLQTYYMWCALFINVLSFSLVDNSMVDKKSVTKACHANINDVIIKSYAYNNIIKQTDIINAWQIKLYMITIYSNINTNTHVACWYEYIFENV